jgi:dipeptidyl aminopeptidase/acylaminoacyl peptidase
MDVTIRRTLPKWNLPPTKTMIDCLKSRRVMRASLAVLMFPAVLSAQDNGGLKRWTVDDVLAMKGVSDIAVSPDGKRIAYVVTERNTETNVSNSDVWIVSATGGDARKVTSGPKADRAPQWSNDGTWLTFLSDRTNNRLQVYGIDPSGGEAWQITRHESAVGSYKLSPDSKRVVYLAAPPASRAEQDLDKARGKAIVRDSAYAAEFTRLWEVVLKDREPVDGRVISPEGLHVTSYAWGPDSRSLAFGARPQPTLVAMAQGAVYVQSEPGAESRAVTVMPGTEEVVGWTSALGLLIEASGEFTGTSNSKVWTVPITVGDPVSLTDALDEDAQFVAATATELLVEASVKTGRALFRIPLAQGKASGPPVRVSTDRFTSSFKSAGGTLAFLSESSTESPEVYASTGTTFAPRRLTSTNPQVATFAHGAQRIVSWKSAADSESIEGVLSLPVGYQEGTRVPLLVVVHGGPAGVSSARYPGTGSAYPVQVFNSLGYAVLQPNFRGSTGYGARFRGLNLGDILGKDWIDVNSGVDAMIRTGIADSTKMGLMGWSYGGFQTFWGITQTRRFAAASAGAGVNDLTAFFSQTDISDYLGMLLTSPPWEKPELYLERSAYRKVKDVTTPLLIQSGAEDRRVSPEQSIQFYEAMKRIGKAPVKLVLYPGQGHGVNDVRLMKDRMLRNVEWFSYWIPVVGQKPVIRMN